VTFRSGLEERIADNLTKHKCSFEYEPMSVSYTIEYKYTPDFVLSNGIIIEAKGFFRDDDQRKHRAVREAHPELDIRFVFSNINSRVQRRKLTCGEWCEKYNFQYAQEKIPLEWIEHV
jgi:hypothetical protein